MPELFMPTPVAPTGAPRTAPPALDSETDAAAWNHTLQLPEVSDTEGLVMKERRKKHRSHHSGGKKRDWKKLLWVKQDYADNWVDPTFLKDLQRNVNVHPYNFYSLVAESTVVVQHLASAVIFVTSFVAIYMETVSPVTVVMVSSILTIAGWLVWDMGWEQREAAKERAISVRDMPSTPAITPAVTPSTSKGLGVDLGPDGKRNSGSYFPPMEPEKPASVPAMDGDHSAQLRKSRILATAKSALLIYFTLLGLSPILRSLTKGVTSDSIWAIATWLFIANFLSFDYGSGIERNFPASFSTNAAITSSVVLASRLTDTSHVFSLMLFSIQVFGLFPVFRRTVKHQSWNYHVLLTVVLVLGAAGGLWVVVGNGWAVAWLFGVIVGMGGCGWWMIDLQKYKNEIHGPWDPARPVIRGQWA